ncbi:MAG TPA: serine hydrolase domain-containing protein [Bacteroidales bacterium]|nr:serine hydrolase domain-containing protein [Bacteroidales bacterium]
MVLLCSLQALNGQMQQAVDEIRNKYDLMGLSVVTVCDGKISGAYHAGLRDYERNLPVNDSTMYRIASISKLVMTTAMMKLYDKKLFKLDDDVSKYLGFTLRNPNHPDRPITIRMLLSHTSSINEGSGYDGFLTATYTNVSNPPDFSQLLTPGGAYYTEDMWRKETPGEYYTYCNANFGLAGTLIEKISGQNFDEFMSENLFIPLGITGSYIAEGVTDLNNLAVIYRNEEGKWAPQTDDFKGTLSSPRDFSGYKTGTNAAVFSPQGGLRISALELAKVMMLHLDKGTFNGKRIISKKSIRLMHTPQWTYNGNNGDTDGGKDKCYGLSVHILTNTPSGDVIYSDSKMMGHGGDAYGLISKFYFDPDTRSGLILITNGIFNPLTKGSHSVFYDFEEAVFSSVRQNSLFRCGKK